MDGGTPRVAYNEYVALDPSNKRSYLVDIAFSHSFYKGTQLPAGNGDLWG